MKNHFGHFNASEEALAREMWDFKVCTYPGGKSYGIPDSATCRKAPEGVKEEKEEKKKAKAASKIGQAETLGPDGLRALKDGGKVDLADGRVFQKKDDKFYRVKEDGSLSTLDYKPGELASEAKFAASNNPRPTKGEADATPDNFKKGSLAPAADAWKSRDKLESAAEDWRKRQGLKDEAHDHDMVHVATHSFLGRSSEDLARMQGTKGVTPTEEILVNLISQHAAGGGGAIQSIKALLADARDMKDFFGDDLTPEMAANWDKSSTTAIKIFQRMSKKDGFDDFISQMDELGA